MSQYVNISKTYNYYIVAYDTSASAMLSLCVLSAKSETGIKQSVGVFDTHLSFNQPEAINMQCYSYTPLILIN